MAETAGAVPATLPGFFGGGPGQNRSTLPHDWLWSRGKASAFRFREHSQPRHLAATKLTSMVSPLKTPVTVAFLPACLSSVSKAFLSVVCKM